MIVIIKMSNVFKAIKALFSSYDFIKHDIRQIVDLTVK